MALYSIYLDIYMDMCDTFHDIYRAERVSVWSLASLKVKKVCWRKLSLFLLFLLFILIKSVVLSNRCRDLWGQTMKSMYSTASTLIGVLHSEVLHSMGLAPLKTCSCICI